MFLRVIVPVIQDDVRFSRMAVMVMRLLSRSVAIADLGCLKIEHQDCGSEFFW